MIEYIIGLLLTIAVFSFIYREGILYRAAESLLLSIVLAMILWGAYYYFLKPQIELALLNPLRFAWFILGFFILICEIPFLKFFLKIPLFIFTGLSIGIFIIGILQGFLFPQLKTFVNWNSTGMNLLSILISFLCSFFVVFFFINNADKKQLSTTSTTLLFIGKLILYFSFAVIFSGIIFTMGSYISGRILFVLSPFK